MTPFFQALQRIGVNINTALHTEDMLNDKNGTAFITCMTDTYIRGANIGEVGGSKTLCIVDEAQNFTKVQLIKILSRICEGSKCVVIGHNLQNDLKNPNDSGFVPMLEHFKSREWCEVCTLTENYRGDVSRWADLFKG
jgi:predicted ribonuclease YlaK